MKKKDGTVFPVEGTFSVIEGPEGAIGGHVGIIRDITERKKADKELREYREHLEEMVLERTRELKEAQAALVQREKLKTLGATAAEVAHEIRNPLVSIGGFARRLQKKYPESPEAEIILHETERLETMLNRLHDYLRPVDMKPRECHVNAILTDSVGLLGPELEKNEVKIHLDLYPDLPTAHVDPAILTQVFVAMIRNAVEMMDMDKRDNPEDLLWRAQHLCGHDQPGRGEKTHGTRNLCFCHSKRVARGPGFPRHSSFSRKWAARFLFPNTTQKPYLRFRSLNAMKSGTVK